MPNTTIETDDTTPPPHYCEGEAPRVTTSDTARQGPKGQRGLAILVASLVAIAVARAIIEVLFRYST
jgi:hypothetical protein